MIDTATLRVTKPRLLTVCYAHTTQTARLELSKAANPSEYYQVGQIINYTYTIKNTGNVNLTGIFSVSDDKASVTCSAPEDGTLSPNEEMICSATYAITQADLYNGIVTNSAFASGFFGSNRLTQIQSMKQSLSVKFPYSRRKIINHK